MHPSASHGGLGGLMSGLTTLTPPEDASPLSIRSTPSAAFRELERRIVHCSICPTLVGCRTRPVPGEGSVPAHIMFIGEAPGRFGADKTGVPFTQDRSGLLFRRVLSALAVLASESLSYYVTNAVKCLPADTAGRNRTPTTSEIKNCSNHLKREIDFVRPRVIVPLGRTASRLVLGTPDIVWWRPVGSCPSVYPAKHPAYVVRGGGRERLNEDAYLVRLAPILELASRPELAG
jgi:uracil-DNA glycosylase family 4